MRTALYRLGDGGPRAAEGVKVEENTGTTPTISIHGFGPLAPSGAVKRMRRPITLPPGARRSAKAWSTMTAGDVGCASAAVNPRPARTRTSNTSNRFVATKFTCEAMTCGRAFRLDDPAPLGSRNRVCERDSGNLRLLLHPLNQRRHPFGELRV